MTRAKFVSRILPRLAFILCLSGPWAVAGSEDIAVSAKTFEFVAFGDMPYRKADYPRFESLIRQVNDLAPAFTIHVGDFKSGGSRCDDDIFLAMRDYFDDFEGPLIFTPGDNDWSDCDRYSNGSYAPKERLTFLREIFFAAPSSMGKSPLELTRQSDIAPQYDYPENAMWVYRTVAFATIHMVGSDNNMGDDEEEFRSRNRANVTWIARLFDRAARERYTGVVLAFHADPFGLFARSAAFAEALAAIAEGATRLGKPVLMIHGDGHRYTVDHPLRHPVSREKVLNLTRVEVFGGSEMHAVRITVDPDSQVLFQVHPLRIPGN